MLSIAFSQSKYYVDNLSENIKRGHRQKLKDGIWPQNAPVGYLNDSDKKVIVPDPERSPYIVRAFEAYATGKYTLRQVRDMVNELGLRSRKEQELSISNIHNMLKNPILYVKKSNFLWIAPLQLRNPRRKARTDYFKETF